jgi:spermidine/putrescine transport system substrate-binding protein
MKNHLVALLFLTFLFSACRGPAPVLPESTAEAESIADRVLNIYNWDTYIDPGVLTSFATEFDATINYDTFESPEELLATVRADTTAYDVIFPPDHTVPILRQENLLATLRKENLPNFRNIAPDFLNPVYDPGNRFCVPYQWGTMGIGYNIAVTGKEIESWAEFFDPAYAGRIALLDDMRNTLGSVLLYLGYSPNTTNAREIGLARDFLLSQADKIALYAPDTGQDLLLAGEIDLALEWSGDIFQSQAENADIKYVIPSEGSMIWTDNVCITAGSDNRDLAEAFINYLLDAEVGAAISNFTRYGSPNRAALPLINESDRLNPVLYPSDEVRDRLFFLVDVGSAQLLYEKAWADILARRDR